MVWRESFPPATELTLDVEAERERRLVAQARAGADWALTALIARYQPAVTRYLTRLCGNQSRARELAERVFQRMERRLHGPHGADNLRLWLLRASTEAGLESLRRPQRGQPPLLESTRVAGLLPEESGAESPGGLRGRIDRLRNVVGAVSRQARPLIWQAGETTSRTTPSQGGRARDAIEPGPVDETLDTLDPREALRHRLVRITLAELPYGDAQCLALHLVAGLNQVEVARALGITGSAARKRIVQGLSQFSERYRAAVQSLELPEELGYGDALPRRIEEEGPTPIPEPEPVIVPETPEEMVAGMAEPAPPTIPLAAHPFDDGAIVSDGVYYAGEPPQEQLTSADDSPEVAYFTSDGEAELDSSYDEYDEDTGLLADSVFGPPHVSSPSVVAEDELDQEFAATGAAAGNAEDELDQEFAATGAAAEDSDESDAPYGGSGSVMRIAADAIVGPVVDALPVHSEPLAMSPGLVSPGPRSTPLVYELDSGAAEADDAEAGGITMNWIDSTGMMAPLSFEAIVTDTPADAADAAGGDPWERSTILDLETPVEPVEQEAVSEVAEDAEEDIPPADMGAEPLDASAPRDLSIALAEGDYGWERGRQDTIMPETSDASLAYEMLPSVGQAPGVFVPDLTFDDRPSQDAAAPRPAPPVTRTLEDLWDETPEAYER